MRFGSMWHFPPKTEGETLKTSSPAGPAKLPERPSSSRLAFLAYPETFS